MMNLVSNFAWKMSMKPLVLRAKVFSGISSAGSTAVHSKSAQTRSQHFGWGSPIATRRLSTDQGRQDVLTKHKHVVAQYLAVNFEEFFSRYNSILVGSNSYVTKRQSIKLLGEILLDRANYNVMMAYVDSGDHLKICMNLLKDDRKMVQYEGFHVFKVSSSPSGPCCFEPDVARSSLQILTSRLLYRKS